MKFAPICMLMLFVIFQPTMAQDKPITISGKVVENAGHQALEYSTVKLLDTQTDQLISGTTTAADGSFSLETKAADFYLEVGFIGFIKLKITDFDVVNRRVELGVIALSEDTETLDEVVVQGEKSQTVFKLDKRVFNVGSDLSSTGASALEVLNNVPSVAVNIEGQIRLRGSTGVQILINGKPSVLTSEGGNALGTLTADMIESIEVITNPSAKYEASGTSGIINIILKKEEKRGLNGSVTLNTGVPNNHSLGFSLNNRTEKFNLFSQIGIGHRTFPQDFKTINRNLENDTTVNSVGDSEKNEKFINVILGTDYHINAQNVLSLTGSFAYEFETEYSNSLFSEYDAANSLTSQWSRNEVTEATNPKYQYELQYKKSFKRHEDQMLLFSALGSFFGKDQSSEFENMPVIGNESLSERQQTVNNFYQGEYTFKLDYTHPFSDKITLEGGAQYVINDVSNDYAISEWEDIRWVEIPELSNLFDYNQKVLGIYGTGAYEGDKFGVKLGLRVENTDLETVLQDTDESNQLLFTNLFPSTHLSYKVLDNFSLQGGYSRRISRPRLWDLNPFYNIRNNYNISTGNPELLPEYTDSYEVNGIFDQGPVSLNAAVYYRYTTDVVEDVTTFEDNISITRPENIGTNKATGIEVNAKYDPADWWSLNGDFNYNYFKREGDFEGTSFDFNADQWSARMTSKFGLPADFDVEITGNYQSGYLTFQREMSGYVFADLGVRKKIMKGKTIVNLSIRDVFASRIFESETRQSSFYLYDYRLRGRFITLGVSYGFGKGEAMEFSGQKRF
ncbi:outer membrane receptor protein involved in Fe transport [Catalinimonas alkaloidigena]|uniref:TonB-dependent receptor domain-containing protein n=1 Tax=Catalinimonas alkaloidigena TaxID=1075417 RepID=UPI0024073F6F|nr:TonB-dependent receptor [Catalinimonas alkaloidigena]MDF9797951.1 outer membrane receptor protein involved in Fe transport [Catalinimonas alkaloidigena]